MSASRRQFLAASAAAAGLACAPALASGARASNPIALSTLASASRMTGVAWIAAIFTLALFATVMSTLDSYLFLSATTVGHDAAADGISPEDERRRTRIGLAVSALLASAGALVFDSAITVWHHVGSVVTIDGIDVTEDIRTPEVTSSVSPVAAIAGVRRVLAARQREWAINRGAAVVEGRDIGSAVFPAATMKIYLTASVEERARRRAAQTGETNLEDMKRRIAQRDEIDSNREHDPLTIAEDAEVIDSTGVEIDDVVDGIVERWTTRLASLPGTGGPR